MSFAPALGSPRTFVPQHARPLSRALCQGRLRQGRAHGRRRGGRDQLPSRAHARDRGCLSGLRTGGGKRGAATGPPRSREEGCGCGRRKGRCD
jgi:hypothetical protein